MFAYGVFKVIYSPVKAFKEIIQNPKYAGPILAMILFVAASAGFTYILASKTYDEQTLPKASASSTSLQKDEWTENRTWWTSNVSISESSDSISESSDRSKGCYYGNKSMEFSAVNSKQMWMRIDFPEPIQCSGSEGYKNISFRIKLIYPDTTTLNSASIYLYSNQANYFHYNLTKKYSLQSNSTRWNSMTISLGSSSEWTNSGADWSNIASLMFEFIWSESANLTVRLDGLFFRGIFKSTIESSGFNYLFSFSLIAFMQFIVTWVLLSGLIFLIAKGLGANTLWKPLLIVVGSALIALFVQAAINVAAVAPLPTLYRPLELLGGVSGEGQHALNKLVEDTWLASRISGYVQIAVQIWIIALCAIATRLMTEFAWTKSLLVAAVSYFIGTLIESFILGF